MVLELKEMVAGGGGGYYGGTAGNDNGNSSKGGSNYIDSSWTSLEDGVTFNSGNGYIIVRLAE